MAINQELPPTDSAAALHELIGEDSTATFENDPTFVESNPAVDGSSENLQTRTDRQEVRNSPSVLARDTDDVDEEDEDEDDEDDDDEYEDVETEDEDEDEEDEDDADEDDLDEDDDEDEDDEEEEDEE